MKKSVLWAAAGGINLASIAVHSLQAGWPSGVMIFIGSILLAWSAMAALACYVEGE